MGQDKKQITDIIVDSTSWNRKWVNSFASEKDFLASKTARNAIKHYDEKAREQVLKKVYASK